MKWLLLSSSLAGMFLLAAGPAEDKAQNVPGQCVDTPYSAPCAPSGGNSSSRPSVDPYEAKQYSRFLSNYHSAIKLYNKAIGANVLPEKALGMLQEALADINEALQYNPNDEDSLKFRRQIQGSVKCILGRLAAARGDYDQAIALLREAEQIYPESNARWEGIIADFQRDGERNALWARASELNNTQRDYKGAEAVWRQIIASHPDDSYAYSNLGITLDNEGRHEDSLEALEQALKLNPKNQDAASRIEGVRRSALWDRASELNNTQRDYKGAEIVWRQIIASHPDDSYAYSNLAVVLKNQGRNEESLAAYRHALTLDPKNNDAPSGIADVESRIDADRVEKVHEQQNQALKQQDSSAVATISSKVGNLINNIGSGDGQTHSTYRMVNGKLVEFTTLGQPAGGAPAASGQLAGIVGDDQKAKDSTLNQGADSINRLQFGFDTAGNPGKPLQPVVLSGSAQPPAYDAKTMKAIENDEQYKRFMQTKAAAEQRYQELGGKLKEVNTAMTNHEGDTGELQVTATQILNQMAAARSDAVSAGVNAQDRAREISFTINMTETPTKPKPAPPPSPAPGAGGTPQN